MKTYTYQEVTVLLEQAIESAREYEFSYRTEGELEFCHSEYAIIRMILGEDSEKVESSKLCTPCNAESNKLFKTQEVGKQVSRL